MSEIEDDQTMSSKPNNKRVNSAKDLDVYRFAYDLAMAIFELSKRFPPEEKFALTTQIRRSSRSVCLNLREAWAKRRYQAHFVSKLTDSDGENSETDSSLDFAKDCRYTSAGEHQRWQPNEQTSGASLCRNARSYQARFSTDASADRHRFRCLDLRGCIRRAGGHNRRRSDRRRTSRSNEGRKTSKHRYRESCA